MFSLQRLVGGDGEFFVLLEASAEQAAISAQALLELLQNPIAACSLDKLLLARLQDKRLTEEILRLLCRSFVTPIEREDIENLASAINRIPKALERFGQQFLLSQSCLGGADFSRQVVIIVKATDTVLQMVKDVRHSPEVAVVKEQNDRLQFLEGEADKLLVDLMKDLYSGRYEPLPVLALGSLYELLEKVVDRCRDAGNILFGMALKLN